MLLHGVPHLIYTCLDATGYNRQCVARAVDPADPMLREWANLDANPVIDTFPPGGNKYDFRDPAAFRVGNGSTMIAIASSVGTGDVMYLPAVAALNLSVSVPRQGSRVPRLGVALFMHVPTRMVRRQP